MASSALTARSLPGLNAQTIRALFKGTRIPLTQVAKKAGVAPGVVLSVIQRQASLPAPGEPTTHILKPAIPSYPGTTANEAFVMRLAAEMGLPVAKVEARRLFAERGLQTFLLVERYDRDHQHGRVVRLHQEDFCQALGLTSAYKYENHLGPGLARCRRLLLDHSEKPGADARDFIDAVMFNLIVGNGDAHAKNFSFLFTPKGIRLAPLYDLLSTVYYPGLSMGMAMSIDGRFRFADMDRQALESGAKAIGLNRTFLTKRLDLLRDKLPGAANRAAAGLLGQGLDDAVLERLVCERADRLRP
ncbi:HipA domain-containing protein [Geothrix oryzae]|nr:HipA domain-containing protein [Geothrix oryzae]